MSDEEKDKEKKGEESAEAKVARIQANAQAYLMGAYEKIAREIRKSPYKVVLAHTPKESDAGSGVGLVSKLANPAGIQRFISASPAELSILVPRLEFFFVHEQNGQLVEEPFVFSDHTSGERIRALSKQLYGGELTEEEKKKDILNSSVRGSQVGVKEFNWMFDNKHEGDKTLKASVTLVFASAQELLTRNFLNFIFNVNSPEELVKSSQDKKRSFDDITKRFVKMKELNISQAPQEESQQAKKDFKQLKIKVGWSMPQRSKEDLYVAGVDKSSLEDYIEAVAATQKTILLNFTKYKLEFGQQGQVNLQIEYVGSLDSLIADPEASDVFSRVEVQPENRNIIVPRALQYSKGFVYGYNADGLVSDTAFGFQEGADPVTAGSGKFLNAGGLVGFISRELHKPEQQDPYLQKPGFNINLAAIKYEEDTLLMARQYLKEENDRNGEKHAKQISALDKGIDACRVVRSMIDARRNTARHSQFMQQLLSSGKIRYATISPGALKSGEPSAAISSGRSAEVKIGVQSASDGLTLGKRQQAFGEAMANKRTKDSGIDPPDSKYVLDPNKPSVEGEKEESRVLFFTIGDLIDIANSIDDKGNRQTLLELVDGRIVLGSFNGKDIGLTKNNSVLPIADIPINVEWFGQWFIDNYTGGNPPPQRISLRSFINKLLSNLVAPLMNQALQTPDKKVSINFSMTTLTYPRINGTDLAAIATNGRFDNAMATSVSEAAATNKAMSDAKNTRTFFLIFATIKDPGKLRGDPQADRENGIFHVTLGSDRGIVKSFTFSEKKMPQLRAMHIENNNKGSALILPQDVELTMVGNTFFRNGSIIYINGDFAFGAIARKLGIGGYYMVVKSENTINPSTFETRLTCMFLQRPGEK